MELAITIIAGLGILFFVVSFLAYILAGFKHHFVTGIISAIPVLNIVTIPSLWHNSRGKVITAFIGLILASAGWFMGADRGVKNMLSTWKTRNNSNETVILSSRPDSANSSNNDTQLDEKEMLGLPEKALYKMVFNPVPLNTLSTLTGQIIQITNTNNDQIEGRVTSITSKSVLIDSGFDNEIPIANIKKLRLMVKKSIQ